MSKMDVPLDQIIQGDCIEVLKSLPSHSVDLIFADPPYNLQLQQHLYRPNRTMVDAVDDQWDQFDDLAAYDAFTRAWLTACRRVLKDTGTIWVIGSYHNLFRVGTAMMDLGYWILNEIVWRRANPMPNFRGARFTNATETLIWAKRAHRQPRYTFNYLSMKNLNDDVQMTNVWHIPICGGSERIRIDGKRAHSTQKPEALLYRVLLSSSNPGDVVLDPFFGTGTTGAVAKRLDRRYIGIERDPTYVEIARERIAKIPPFSADPALLVTRSKRDMPRVAFSALVESGYVQIGQKLYSSDRAICAMIRADGHLIVGSMTGSIHKLPTLLLNQPGLNGWTFWHYENENGRLISLDRIRERYRADHAKPPPDED